MLKLVGVSTKLRYKLQVYYKLQLGATIHGIKQNPGCSEGQDHQKPCPLIKITLKFCEAMR